MQTGILHYPNSEFNTKEGFYRNVITKEWFAMPRKGQSKLPNTIHKSFLKGEIANIIVLLHNLRGDGDAFNLVE